MARAESQGCNKANQRTTFTNAAGTYLGYSYDRIGQLKIADSSQNAEDRGYTYDTAWNLNFRTNNGVTETFSVDSKNQLTSTPQGTASYDSNGNILSYVTKYGSGTVTRTLTYDDENRLISVVGSTVYRSDFIYDGLSRMRKKIDYTWNGTTWVASATAEYIYDGLRMIQERDGANTPTASYTRGTDLSGSLEGAGGIGGLLARSSGYSSGNWTTHNFYHADGNGNITALVDSSQALSATYRYDPFGATIGSSGSQASVNPFRFSSKQTMLDSSLTAGVYYYHHRFYDAGLQRWVNRDPAGERGGINLYEFVASRPINAVDPLGLNLTIPQPNPWPVILPILFPPSRSPTPSLPEQLPTAPAKPKSPKLPGRPPGRFLCRLGFFIGEMLDPISLNPVDDFWYIQKNPSCHWTGEKVSHWPGIVECEYNCEDGTTIYRSPTPSGECADVVTKYEPMRPL